MALKGWFLWERQGRLDSAGLAGLNNFSRFWGVGSVLSYLVTRMIYDKEDTGLILDKGGGWHYGLGLIELYTKGGLTDKFSVSRN